MDGVVLEQGEEYTSDDLMMGAGICGDCGSEIEIMYNPDTGGQEATCSKCNVIYRLEATDWRCNSVDKKE